MGGPRAPGVIISVHEINRMRELVNEDHIDSAALRRNKLNALKKISEERISKWTNTLEASREQQIREKQRKLKDEEARLKELDKQEESYREQKRQNIIGRAREIMFQNTDVAKRLASATLISDVLKEREYQAEVKNAIEKEKKQIDQEYHLYLLDKMKQMDEASAAKERERKLAQVEVSKMLKHQVEVLQQRRSQEKEEQRIIGQKLREQAELAVVEEEKRHRERQMQLKLQKKIQFESNQRLEELKAVARAKEAEEEKKVEQYAKEKEERLAMLKAKAAEREKARTERRQRMIEQQQKFMEEQVMNAEQRLEEEQKQNDEKKEREERSKAEKQRKLLQDIQMAIDDQLERKKQAAKEKLAQELRDLEAANQNAVDYEKQEKRKKAEMKEKAKALAKFHRKQIIAKREELRLSNPLRNDAAVERLKKQQRDTENFQRYAHKVVASYENEGKDIKPMHVAMRHGNIAI